MDYPHAAKPIYVGMRRRCAIKGYLIADSDADGPRGSQERTLVYCRGSVAREMTDKKDTRQRR